MSQSNQVYFYSENDQQDSNHIDYYNQCYGYSNRQQTGNVSISDSSTPLSNRTNSNWPYNYNYYSNINNYNYKDNISFSPPNYGFLSYSSYNTTTTNSIDSYNQLLIQNNSNNSNISINYDNSISNTSIDTLDSYNSSSSSFFTSSTSFPDSRQIHSHKPTNDILTQNILESNYSTTSTTSANITNDNIISKTNKTKSSSLLSSNSINSSSKQQQSSSTRRHQQLSDHAVDIMNNWFLEHINNPYPQLSEKENLARLGGITVKQVTAWFSNRRNRSQNTKPKRMKRVLQNEINNLFNELHCGEIDKEKIIQKFNALDYLGSNQ